MSEPENVKAVMMGPCSICGDTGYPPSMGGPFICPQCDCGNFTQATVMRQAKELAQMREENERLRGRLEHLQNEAADIVRENKELRSDKESLATGWESDLEQVGMLWPLPARDCPNCHGAGRVGVMACMPCGATGVNLVQIVSRD